MGSKQKQAQIGQKESFELKLKNRRALLSEEGIESRKIEKDPLVKKLKANVTAMNNRLKAIDASEKKNEELAKMKLEKAAAPRKEPEGTKGKKVKETPVEVKVKDKAKVKDKDK
ncbi:MAG: hypothetical protein WCW53_08050, partial [Syntrophales bacterium]